MTFPIWSQLTISGMQGQGTEPKKSQSIGWPTANEVSSGVKEFYTKYRA